MINKLKRHEVRTLLRAGHTQKDSARIAKVSHRTVRRIAEEPEVQDVDDGQERFRRAIGRPSTTEPFRDLVQRLMAEEPTMLSVEVLRRARLEGYRGGKSALFALAAGLRPRQTQFTMRFEGLPGEFSQHDFGEVRVRFLDDSIRKVQFFASRLKWSRWVEVSLVEHEAVASLVRKLACHFERFGGVPLCSVFDRPKPVAIRWGDDGVVTEWNLIFAYAALELGFAAEVCWPHQPRQKGSIENLVGWVKGSLFKQRRFHDTEEVAAQLGQWLQEVNAQRPSRATGEIPLARMEQERKRLRAVRTHGRRVGAAHPSSGRSHRGGLLRLPRLRDAP